jgi:hypothetical protein
MQKRDRGPDQEPDRGVADSPPPGKIDAAQGAQDRSIFIAIAQLGAFESRGRLAEGPGVAGGRARLGLEKSRDHVVEGVDESEREIGLDLGRDIDQIFFVMAWQEHGLNARTSCRQDLFTHAADR